jgi:indole-3-glycerol phosphate synthase
VSATCPALCSAACNLSTTIATSTTSTTIASSHTTLLAPVLLWLAAGCGAILVGESLVKQGDPEAAVKALLEL